MSLITTKTLSENVRLHELDGYIQSIYLIEYKDKLLLLDGCCRADISLLKTYIESTLQREFSNLAAIIVTHMHPDHAGAAHKLRKITGCKIYTANVDGHWYAGFDGYAMYIVDILLAKWVAKRKGRVPHRLWYNPHLKADVKLKDGERVPGFESWQVIYTQGHTDRCISLKHVPSNIIYVADLMVTVKGKYIPPFPLFFPNRYFQSLTRIKNMEASSLILAHGGEITPSEQDYQHLMNSAPKVPLTHWRTVKLKLKRMLSRT